MYSTVWGDVHLSKQAAAWPYWCSRARHFCFAHKKWNASEGQWRWSLFCFQHHHLKTKECFAAFYSAEFWPEMSVLKIIWKNGTFFIFFSFGCFVLLLFGWIWVLFLIKGKLHIVRFQWCFLIFFRFHKFLILWKWNTFNN